MLVKLTKQWFAPNGQRFRPGTHEVPASWEKLLPKTAEVIPTSTPKPKA